MIPYYMIQGHKYQIYKIQLQIFVWPQKSNDHKTKNNEVVSKNCLSLNVGKKYKSLLVVIAFNICKYLILILVKLSS